VAPGDFSPVGSTLNFGSVNGTETQTVTITVIDDGLDEETESVYARLIVGTEQNVTISDYEGSGYIYDNDTVNVTGRVFFDVNGNGFFDAATDYGLPNLTATITDLSGAHTGTTNASGTYTIAVLLGSDSILVDATDPDLPEGAIASTSANPLVVAFTATVLTASDIGFTVEVTDDVPVESLGEGGGANNDTAYGGPGNDTISGGGGDDWLIGGHWLGPGGAGSGNPYDATLLEQASGDGGRKYVQFNAALLGTIGDRVFLDVNADGRHQVGEPGIKNIQVNLFDYQWQLIATTWTDSTGSYQFTKLAPTGYYVQFLSPSGYKFTAANVAGNAFDGSDSDADPMTGLTGLYTITAGLSDNSIDAGLIALPAASPGPWSVSFSQVTYSARETDGFATITILGTPGTTQAIGVFWTLAGTATNALDYTGLWENGVSGARKIVRFGVGETEKSFVIPLFTDTITESPETVLLYLANPTGGPVKGNLPTSLLLIFDSPCPDDDSIFGGEGNDVILGDYGYFTSAGGAELLGGMGNDKLYGQDGDDKIYGEGGNDTLDGGTDNDTLDGGSENDTYVYDGDKASGSDTIIEAVTPFGGTDTIDLSQTSGWSVNLDLSSTALQTVTPSLQITLPLGNVIENALGGSRDDILIGNALDNLLEGRDGNDTLTGGDGNDQLIGGNGSDTYLFDADGPLGHDDLTELVNATTDADVDVIDFGGTTTQGVSVNLGLAFSQLVAPTLSLTLSDAAGFENLYGGDQSDTLIGNARDNVIWGRAGNDNLDGAAHGTVGDTLREDRGSGFVLTNTTLTVTATGEVDTYANFENVSLAGDDNANLLDASTFSGVVRLDGRGGNDTLRGGTGTNYLTGGAGDDLIVASVGTDIITESRDADFVLTNTSLALNLVGGGTETDTYDLTAGAIEQANLTGGDSANVLNASTFTGTVTLDGGAGNDTLIGTANADTLIGGAGDDSIQGRDGNDTYAFAADTDLGSDTIVETATGGTDTLDFSGTLSQELTVDLSLALAQVVNHNLTLTLSAGNVIENLIGGQQDDVLIGNDLVNHIEGRRGNDTLTGALGHDILDGGANVFFPLFQAWVDRVVETRNANMILTSGSLSFGGGETDTLISIEAATLTGGVSNNTLDAGAFSGSVTLNGEGADDILLGGTGNDFLTGGAGDDSLQGGLGDDTYLFNADTNLGTDTVDDSGGTDILDYSATSLATVTVNLGSVLTQTAARLPITLIVRHRLLLMGAAMIENLTGGALNDTLTGNALDNVLTGNNGNDRLTGREGDDTLIGGNGDDTYVFDADGPLGTDTIFEDVGSGGTDTLDFSATSAAITVDLGCGVPQTVVAGNLMLQLVTCHSIENVIGGAGSDTITGNSLDNRIEGGAGNDTLTGEMGNDTYVFDADFTLGTDTINENADSEGGTDTLDFSATTSVSVTVDLSNGAVQFVNGNLSLDLNPVVYPPSPLPNAFENLSGGAQADILVGNDLDNVITGGAGADTLLGNDGNDTLNGCGNLNTLIGADGNDSLYGGAGNDTYVFDLSSTTLHPAIPQGTDTIFEVAGEGYADTILGLGLGGVAVDLHSGGAQQFYDVNSNLVLVLVLGNPGQVEHSF
jgi:Ca2+-binding RTX toxin-like protein